MSSSTSSSSNAASGASELAPFVTTTIHPSAILRARDDEARQAERRAFTEDLRRVADVIRRPARSAR
jgi:hypothetical protein